MRLTCTVNGKVHCAEDVWEGESLLYVLRERFGLYGSKNACEQGECGSCTVLIDGDPVCACLMAAGQAEGLDITTVEGIADDGGLAAVQEALTESGGVQCGFCTPGIVVAAHELLSRNPTPSRLDIREALAGNLCRCTGYEQIIDAVELAAGRRGGFDALPVSRGRIGDSPVRPDAAPKVAGGYEYASDLCEPDMLWGATLRSPHPHARIVALDVDAARALPGVHAVLTAADVPGLNRHGIERPDQPVLAEDIVRCEGEPVAIVAATHPEIARRALEAIRVEYEVLAPLVDSWVAAFDAAAPRIHPEGNIVRHIPVRRGDMAAARAASDVVVAGEYEVGMQDQAFLGPEAGLARPLSGGGVELRVASQWIHLDRMQIARALDLPMEQVRVELSGIGGAFGGREDLTVHVHACMLALRTGRPVKMMYNREESFHGHVHRHPVRMRYEHGASRDGVLQYVEATIVFDGGPYASCSPEVIFNAAVYGAGPYVTRATHNECLAVFTNNPICGAMRGFGAVQVAVAYEAQMDKLAKALGMHPIEFRQKNALSQGDAMPTTGQRVEAPAPVAEMLALVRDLPLPPSLDGDQRNMPGGLASTSRGEGVRRGIGYAIGFKNVAFGEGADDHSTAGLRLERLDGRPVATVGTAAAEVGQGILTILGQIVREELGDIEVRFEKSDTSLGDPGATSASRQTYMSGGAVKMACERIRRCLLQRAADRLESDGSDLVFDRGRITSTTTDLPMTELLDTPIAETARHHHRPTEPLNPDNGQGAVTLQFAFCAHRAVVDVDTDLGIIKVVALDAVQDVGRAINPTTVKGQIQGGALQGMGLAVMEELLVHEGKLKNPSFTDYLIPTIVDAPSMQVRIIEHPDQDAPYGVRGVGEPPTISSVAAVVAAVRDATGLELARVPVRADDIVFAGGVGSPTEGMAAEAQAVG
ncbi:xanthine dehydrogenase subunit D [Castellaniella sp. GW247-6E4]|uniref:xanthine dehydrogenase subunit D n=1 Tax=Castellaniella sp. GW247-6E4 TaxID=3140380 RepID=UPI003315FACD